MKRIVRQLALMLMDIVSVNLVFIVALIGWKSHIINEIICWNEYYQMMAFNTIVMILGFKLCGLYNSLWRYAGIREFIRVMITCILGGFGTVLVHKLFGLSLPSGFYIHIGIGYSILVVGIRVGYRLVRRLVWRFRRRNLVMKRQEQKSVMIIGAGEAAAILIKECNKEANPQRRIMVAVDDDCIKHGARINGVPIEGKIKDVGPIAKHYNISEIIIAIPSASKERIAEIIDICSETKCKLKIFPGIDKSLKKDHVKQIRNVNIEDLLGREEIILNNERLNFILNKKTVLVTGGGGSIGSEICRQIVKLPIHKVVILDIYENSTYSLQVELRQQGIPDEKIEVVIGSIRDKVKLNKVFEYYKPDIVFHAAAHKHVPLMEANPEEAVKNNVFGTLNVLQCAAKFKVTKFVLVSTDKAVNPTSVMGATKRIGEMLVEAMNTIVPSTDFVAVRFGNVLGSNGSVIPLFKMQLEKGGPLTVTHPEIERYFMTIPEAVRLILEAVSLAKGGEIFVLDMGKPVKILDLAKKFIRLSGLEEGKDIEIKFTGLRTGEKLYEELLMAEEGLSKTASNKIFIGKTSKVDYGKLTIQLNQLHKDLEEGNDLRARLKEIVPSYQTMEEANKKALNG